MTAQVVLFNSYIQIHNLSLTDGVMYLKIKGYEAVHDTRTHPLSVFASSSAAEMISDSQAEAHRKLLRLFRDKFNEAERPFIPCFFKNVSEYECFMSQSPKEERPGIIKVEKNCPVFTIFPLWNIPNDPLLTLLIRIEDIFFFLSNKDAYKQSLLGIRNEPRDHLKHIEEIGGQGPLVCLSLRKSRMMKVSDIAKNYQTAIEFQEFEAIEPDTLNIINEHVFLRGLDDFRIIPDYLLVSPTTNIKLPSVHLNFHLKAWIDKEKIFHEVFGNEIISINPGETKHIIERAPDIAEGTLFLYTLNPSDVKIAGAIDKYIMEGSYIPSERITTSNIPFYNPVSCKQISIEGVSSYPVFAQRKLDGNRIIVYYLNNGATIKYYSRSGFIQSEKFSIQFDEDVRKFCSAIKLTNIMLDCECYCHEIIHAEIAGLCNSIQTKDDFKKLSLYLLSYLDLDSVISFIERKKEYRTSPLTFREVFSESDIRETDRIKINETRIISSKEELYDFMKESVEADYEGLVIYPLDNRYTFGMDRLLKIKKLYDGEVIPIGYKESEAEAGSIGAVYVKSLPYLGIRGMCPEDVGEIFYYVTAALLKELKPGSMTNVLFQNCLGKKYTIICDSFSDTGVPMHARFKTAFGVGSERPEESL
jgi:hypothetical protein